MSGRRSRSHRRGVVVVAVTVATVVALLVAGLHDVAMRTFVLHSPNQITVAEIHPPQRVCEGPVAGHGAVGGVSIWGASGTSRARLIVQVQDAATGLPLASTPLDVTASEAQWAAELGHTLPGGRPLRICLTAEAGSFSLAGSQAVNPAVVMTGAGPGQEFSLALLSPRRSLFSTFPTAFSRASLWRPSWVGSWTFWVLLIAFSATFAVGIVAVTGAAAADEDAQPSDGDGHEPDAPAGVTAARP